MDNIKRIIIISDGTGKTAKRLVDAVLAQYARQNIDYSVTRIYHEVRDKFTFDKILKNIDTDYLVVYSIISTELNAYFHERLSERAILHINVLEPMLDTMSKFLGVHPDYLPGILQIIDDRYYRKIDAIGFTVEHDDGRGLAIRDADIVLVGLSRTCKTPISMYLSCNFGLKIANIPIIVNDIMEKNLMERLAKVPQQRIYGLLMQPEILMRIREERGKYLLGDTNPIINMQNYFDLHEIQKELRFCRELYVNHDWQTVDVTRRAIEEVSQEILEKWGYVK